MRLRLAVGVLSLVVVALATWQLHRAEAGLLRERISVDGVEALVTRPARGPVGPLVVIAHGFAGSARLMDSFALGLARAGYAAVTFDLPGHGRNPNALTGNITRVDGATRTLLRALDRVTTVARSRGDGRLAVLGHSMSSDLVVRFAEQHADIDATIAVSMFAPTVTASEPRNLLVVVGDWEGPLKREALRAVGLATAPRVALPFVTYGDFAAGTARRVAFSPHVEHASVLFSEASQRESIAWLDAAFGVQRASPVEIVERGPALLAMFTALVALGWSLIGLLPRVMPAPIGASLRWRSLWPVLVVPALATPLVLRLLPTHFLPVLVGDYLASHFALYGLITAACLAWQARKGGSMPAPAIDRTRLALAALALTAFGLAALAWPLDRYVTSFVPTGPRLPLLGAMLVGTLAYFLADEWATRGANARRGAYPASKVAFLLSLALAVCIDFERLFFLVIIVPVIVLFFVVHGLLSGWAYRRTGHPAVAALANAIAFAWAIGVTFPLVAG